jgi:hypothetical protein
MHKAMPVIYPFLMWLRIEASARFGGGYGHLGGHMRRGAGLIIGGKLMIIGLVAIVACVLAGIASLSASEWLTKRYGQADYTRIAGWIIFVVAAISVILVLARFI